MGLAIVRAAQWFQDAADQKVRHGGFAVHVALVLSVATYQEDREWSEVPITTLAKASCCTDKTARVALAELVKAGWLRRSDIPTGPNGYQTRFAIGDAPGGLIAPRPPPLRSARAPRPSNGKQRKGSTRTAVFARDGHACRYCGSPEHLVLDHVIPRCQKGTNDRENLVVACWGCNSKKRGRTPEQAGMVLRPTMVRETAPPVVIDSATAPSVFRAIAAAPRAPALASERVSARLRGTKAHMMPANERLVLRTLAGHADDAGALSPSIPVIAGECGLAEATARKALRGLVTNGWIVCKSDCYGEDGRRAPNGYTLTLETGEWWPDDAREHLARRPPVRGVA